MVGSRCYDKIWEDLVSQGMCPEISQGVIEFQEELDGIRMLDLKESLLELGYEVVDPENSELLDRISTLVETLIYKYPELPISDYLECMSTQGLTDPELIQVFSQVYGTDVFQYASINQVERIKELLLYEDLKLKEIAELFGFKSKAHLKRAFEGITGLPPGFYKKIRKKRLKIREISGFGEKIGAIKEIN